MRGKATGPPRSSGPGGITPAYAGKSGFSPFLALWVEDHPRVCGEKCHLLSRLGGSQWITPAYAGKSLHDYIVDLTKWDHPRVCGEKTKKIP